MPERIQLRRTKGWRKPEGVVVVARPTMWGNPFNWQTSGSRATAVANFRGALTFAWYNPTAPEADDRFRRMADRLGSLRGHDLACWCPLNQPCHADVLLAEANRG